MNKTMIRYSKMKLKQPSSIDDRLIENMGNSLAWICLGVLEGKTAQFEYKPRKLNNFFNFVQEEKARHNIKTEDGVSTILDEAKEQRPYIYESAQEVSTSKFLYIAEISPKMSTRNLNIRAYLMAGYCIIGVWTDRVLQNHYRMPKAERIAYFKNMNNWIDSYQRRYLSNKGINEMFIEDINYDMEKGEKV